MFLLLTVVVAIVGIVWYANKSPAAPKPVPKLDTEEWWGPKELKGKQDSSIRPFQVDFSPALINDLKQRLKNHRKPVPPLEGVGFKYGFNSKALDSWVEYWADKYPFEERQKFLNQFPQFKTYIQGLDIHFIHVKPKVSNNVRVVPLLLLHGWPGSVREFYEAIPLLTTPRDGYDFVFEVVVPSLPGYGFSDAAVRPGLAPGQIAVIFRNLMRRLGYNQFYIQGGDWGSIIASAMATLFPNDILGHHNNFMRVSTGYANLWTVIGAYLPFLVVDSKLADRMYPLSKVFAFLMEEFGYFHLQATKPDTVGVALTDSPVGLLTYILEKFASWTKFEYRALEDGGFKEFTRDQLIDNLMMYWSTNSITTSMRLYAEAFTNENRALNIEGYQTEVPTWVLQAKNELVYQPPRLIRSKFVNLLGTTVLENGGHFFAFELPNEYAKDVFKAVNEFRKWHSRKNNA